MTPQFNFLSRAESLGFSYSGIFMKAIRLSISARMKGNYDEVAEYLGQAARRLEDSSAYKGYKAGKKHARIATAATMMEDLETLIAYNSKKISEKA